MGGAIGEWSPRADSLDSPLPLTPPARAAAFLAGALVLARPPPPPPPLGPRLPPGPPWPFLGPPGRCWAKAAVGIEGASPKLCKLTAGKGIETNL